VLLSLYLCSALLVGSRPHLCWMISLRLLCWALLPFRNMWLYFW
jgi:hypothetical protein